MFKRMMIASEMTTDSFEIFEHIDSLKMLGAEECLLLQCVNPGETNIEIASYMRKVVEENLEKQKKLLVDKGFSVETRILSTNVKKEINRISVDEKFNVIIAGAERHTILGESIFGGVGYELMYHAVRPLLLIRYRGDKKIGKPTAPRPLTDHVMYATDFSDNAKSAYNYVKEMIRCGVKHVSLIHVVDKEIVNPYLVDHIEKFKEIDEKRLMELKEELEAMGDVKIDTHIPLGSPTAEILRITKEKGVTMVVMGSQGRGFLEQVFLGSVSHNIARHSEASVLLIPAERDEL